MTNNTILHRDAVVVLVLTCALAACANIFALESSVTKETRQARAACETAAKAGQDTTDVCRTFLRP